MRVKRDKAAAFEAFESGIEAKDLVKQGFTKTAAYKWQTEFKAQQPPIVEDVPTPPRVEAPTDPVKPGRNKVAVTEETAGMILTLLFNIWAGITHEELRVLTPSQRSRLQGPFAHTLRTIPNPIADLINTYAPPVSFVGSLISVINEQNDLIVARDTQGYNEMEQRRRAAEEAAQRIEEAHEAAAANGAPVQDVPADKRQSTGTPEPEGAGPIFFG